MRNDKLRNKNLIWDVGFVTRCKNGETICGDQCVMTSKNGEKTIVLSDEFSLTPQFVWTYRSHRYNWCFPTGFGAYRDGSGFATVKFELDANYRITDNFGLFAKVAYCSVVDDDLRHNIDHDLHGADYGDAKDFVWGGVGVTFNF